MAILCALTALVLVVLMLTSILLYLDGNQYQEIAEILGISETNVATKISRLKSRMKQKVGTKKG